MFLLVHHFMSSPLQTVYKLIDLGYAKDLNQDSIAKSLVGTWYYLVSKYTDKYTDKSSVPH